VIRIVHLYPRELGINGDVGNVLALRRRAQWRGAAVEVIDHEVGSDLPETAHLVHVGSGPASGQRLVADDIVRIAPALRRWAEAGVPMIAIAGGWQVMGAGVELENGEFIEGAAVYPTRARVTGARVVREVWRDGVAGFENHGAETLTSTGAPVDWPVARFGALIGTTLHGPVLPMNPALADELLTEAARLAGVTLGPGGHELEAVDEAAARSRDAIRRRL
jgi:CobQ-like glutamine amidotransferase family enzyme